MHSIRNRRPHEKTQDKERITDIENISEPNNSVETVPVPAKMSRETSAEPDSCAVRGSSLDCPRPNPKFSSRSYCFVSQSYDSLPRCVVDGPTRLEASDSRQTQIACCQRNLRSLKLGVCNAFSRETTYWKFLKVGGGFGTHSQPKLCDGIETVIAEFAMSAGTFAHRLHRPGDLVSTLEQVAVASSMVTLVANSSLSSNFPKHSVETDSFRASSPFLLELRRIWIGLVLGSTPFEQSVLFPYEQTAPVQPRA